MELAERLWLVSRIKERLGWVGDSETVVGLAEAGQGLVVEEIAVRMETADLDYGSIDEAVDAVGSLREDLSLIRKRFMDFFELEIAVAVSRSHFLICLSGLDQDQGLRLKELRLELEGFESALA
jgi:hypothetical protein